MATNYLSLYEGNCHVLWKRDNSNRYKLSWFDEGLCCFLL